MTLNLTTTSWVLGVFLSLALFTLIITVRAWRESKRSPYFFLRREAEQRMLQYGSSSIALIMIAGAVFFYSYTPSADNTIRMALFESIKPDYNEALAMIESLDDSEATSEVELIEVEPIVAVETDVQVTERPVMFSNLLMDAVAPIKITTNDLPVKYSQQFEATEVLKMGTGFGEIAFSDEINEFYEAINPDRVFPARFFTLYATFVYEDMVDGMEWAWVWRHNGEVIDGGTEVWAYGEDGPGYVYLEDGFSAGEYSVQIWVNEEMMSDANVIVTSAASR